ncbi:MAG: FHA domain-containing protein [Verrucomicrobiota bacterium]
MTTQALAAWLDLGGRRFPLLGKTFSLGRANGNNIVFASNKVSRRHALVHAQGASEFSLVDLGSSNGTHLNGRRVIEPVVLHDGDVIQIGEQSLIFQVENQSNDEDEIYATLSQMTVRDVNELTCWFLVLDIENFMGLTSELPPEDLARMVGAWLDECRRIVEEQKGNVSKFLGDGLLVYWDTRFCETSNVAAAIKLLRARQLQHHPPFRWALHYGSAVFGSTAAPGEVSTLGHDVNFLFRIERVAATNKFSSMLSESAQSNMGPLLETKALGSFMIKGVDGEHSLFGC